MRENISDMLRRVGVDYPLGPYQTQPWSHMDLDSGQTCSAEVRMSYDGTDFEAELQMMYDVPPAGKPPLEQLMWFRAATQKDGLWDITHLKIRNEDKMGAIYGAEEKACQLFKACVQKMVQGEMPDFDTLMEEIFKEDERFAGRRSGGAGKAPKIRPQQLLDMKKGAGF
ncbi:MAG: hypothetical protein AB7E85_07890 [Pseudobdellovibrionaceae bacterium]